MSVDDYARGLFAGWFDAKTHQGGRVSVGDYAHGFFVEIRRRITEGQPLSREQERCLSDFCDRVTSDPGEVFTFPGPGRAADPARKLEMAMAVHKKIRNGTAPKAAYSEVSEDFGLSLGDGNSSAAKAYRESLQAIEESERIWAGFFEAARKPTQDDEGN